MELTSSTAHGSSLTSNEHPSTATQPTINKSTITYSSYTTYTITSCQPTVTHCPLHQVTTELVTSTTTICPETTATYTLHQTLTCSSDSSPDSCPLGSTITTAVTVTATPLAPSERTIHAVPGCALCGAGVEESSSAVVSTSVALPTAAVKCRGPGCVGGGVWRGGNGTVTGTGVVVATPTKGVFTAGAARIGLTHLVGALVVRGAVLAVMGF